MWESPQDNDDGVALKRLNESKYGNFGSIRESSLGCM